MGTDAILLHGFELSPGIFDYRSRLHYHLEPLDNSIVRHAIILFRKIHVAVKLCIHSEYRDVWLPKD
jgi:hypothetical protein